MGNGKWRIRTYKSTIVFFTMIIMIIGLSFMLVIKDKSNNISYGDEKEEVNILSYKELDNADNEKIESTYDNNFNKEIINEANYYKNHEKNEKINEQDEENEVDEKVKNEDALICYLTFDDGPSSNITPQILDILKKEEVKATFFVIGSLAEKSSDITLRAFEEGHYIANHTYSHSYSDIYSSEEIFIEDVEMGGKAIENITGYYPKLFRFPGGSFGKSEYINLLESKGYDYVDWNALNGDAESLNVSESTMMTKLEESMYGQNPLVVLMHDAATKQTTADALPKIITYIREQGYEFRTMEKWTRK